ncbi:choice-of-anchor D domain-containing protein [Rickettsiella endosymbiont of Rhagonycha lignosa]|uniref:choice-of-anchor D domain-containing protein n=1 Tax=Rickettsiella endosymbiont of Rhagonycha lignosa TaxID=3077937 RepID=UPI00313BE33A
MNKKNRSIDPIGWSLQNPFPATVVVGEQYEEVYQLVSNLPAPMPAPLTVTHTGGSDFTVEDQCSGLFLLPGQTCNVTVRFSPSNPGAQQFQLTLHYFNDVVPLPVQTITAEGSTLLIEGSVTQALPATTLVDSEYPVIFTFQNIGGSPATNLDLESSYPTGFTEESDTCSGTTLAAGASCTVQGRLIPPSPGSYTVAAALNYAESQTPASVSTSTDAIVVDVTGSVTTPLPSMTEVGDSFPVVFAYTNNSPVAATGVTITTDYPPGFTQQSDNCTGTLNPHSSCTIQGTFIPATAGDFTVGVELAYVEGSHPVQLATSTTADVGALGVTGDVTTRLPAATSIAVSYPVVFTYINQGSVPATGLSITPTYPTGFTQQSDTCTGSLAVGATCTVKGELLPATAGNYTVAVSLAYDQSLNPVPLSTETAAIVVDITGEVSTPLPATTAINTSYSVVFSYTNHSSITATDLVLTPNYPTEFTENENTCASGTLAAGQTCSIEGSLIPSSSGTHTVATSLTYAGAPASIPLSTSTNTLEFVLTGEISTPLPGSVERGKEYPVVFTYTNDSPLPATNLIFTPNYPAEFMQDTNTCTNTLASSASCSVSGTLIPSSSTPPGSITVGLNLAYSEGSPIELTTRSEVESAAIISGTVTQALPATTLVDSEYPVIFTFQNIGGSPATNLDLESSYPTGFTEESDTCSGTTLAAGASCTVQGSLIPPSPGSYTVAAALNYAESQTPASVSTSTDAIVVDVTGNVTTPLPSMTEVGDSFSVVFAYTNNSPVAATGVTITTDYPPGFTQQSDNCTGTLNPHSSCTIQGTFIPATAGDFTVGVELAYVEGSHPVQLATNTTADVGALGITGDVTTPLPATTSIDVSYPVVFTYINQGSVPATGLSITPNYPAGFTPQSDTCTGSLAVGATCTVKGELLPATAGNYSVAVSLAYDQSLNPVPLSTETAAIVVDIAGTVTTDLPEITSPDDSYPVIFSYENNSAADANGVVITPNYPNGFIETANSCTDSTTLEAHSSCSIEGSFTPPSEGDYTVATSLTYSGGVAPIPLETSTTAVAFVLTGDVTIPLPATTELGEDYPVEFTFTNESPLPVTNLNLTPNYPADFMETANTCTNTLAANASCVVSGDFIPSSTTPPEQTISVGTTLTYAEGSPIELITSTEIESQVDISGDVIEGLPPVATASATPLPVVFEYTNNGNAPATGLNLIKKYPPEFTETSTTCVVTLAANTSCQITGNLDISIPGDYSVDVTLNTNEAAPVSLITQTSIIAAEVIGSVVQALPGSTVVNTHYPVTFLFTNKGTADATTVNIVTSYPPDFQLTSETCEGTLAAGASCRVEGILTPTSEGPQTVGVSFQYAEGDDIPLSTSTTVGMLVLQGFVQQGLPDVARANTTYPLIFKYTNPDPDNATGLSISSTGLNITSDTCSGTLAANSSCTIEANFTPTQIGAYTAGVSLSYDQGEDILLNTYTVVGNSLFIAGGGEGFLRTTPTWSKWTTRDNKDKTINLTGTAFSPKLQRYVMVGNYNSSGVKGFLQFTRDGISIHDQQFPLFLPRNIIWNSDLAQFLTIGTQGEIATSVDGVTWVTQTSPVNATLNNANWSPQQHQYVVVGSSGTILTSPDGMDWQSQTSGVSDNLTAVAWSPSLERYVISVNANYVLNSTDGITWTNPGATIEFIAQSVTWSPTLGRFALVGNNTYIATSSDGQQWQKQQSGTTKIINDVIWFSYLNEFYAVGTNTNVYNSATGLKKWDNKSLTTFANYSINAVAAGAVVG